jgi:hypothetical protein
MSMRMLVFVAADLVAAAAVPADALDATPPVNVQEDLAVGSIMMQSRVRADEF